jgi:tetratricopeptide (TPR) repeat protein
MPEDGSEASFSSRADVDALMKDGEAAFAKGDLETAISSYQKASALDPKQYMAALFIGDCYFKKPDHEQAGKWLLRAIEIDPKQETAYRYWGDDLMAQNLASEARASSFRLLSPSPTTAAPGWAFRNGQSARTPR